MDERKKDYDSIRDFVADADANAQPPAVQDPFTFVAKLEGVNDDGSLNLRLIRDDMSVSVAEGDRFFTVTMVCDPFD